MHTQQEWGKRMLAYLPTWMLISKPNLTAKGDMFREDEGLIRLLPSDS